MAMTAHRLTLALLLGVATLLAACARPSADAPGASSIDTAAHEEDNRNWNGPD